MDSNNSFSLLQELWNCWYWKISSWAQAQLSLCHSTAEANWELWLQIDKLGNDSLTDSRLEIITCLTSHKKIPSVLWGKDCAEWRIQKQNQSAELLYSSRCIFCWGGAAGGCCFFYCLQSEQHTHATESKAFQQESNYTAVLLKHPNTHCACVCVYSQVHPGVGSSAPGCCRFRRACGWSWNGRAGPVWDIWLTNSSPNSAALCPYWPHPHSSSHR